MRRFVVSAAASVATFLFVHSAIIHSAHASIIELNAAALSPGISSGAHRGQTLENELNAQVFDPLGMEIEFGAPTGGTVAVDDLALEGPGLTVITGLGFILRFDTPVDQVRIRFGNFKDNDNRFIEAFDFAADYTRDPNTTTQSANGNVTAFPDLGLAIDAVTGIVPAGAPGFLDLVVSGTDNISSILVRSNRFLWTVEEIEVETSLNAVPVPAALPLLLSAVGALVITARRRRWSRNRLA